MNIVGHTSVKVTKSSQIFKWDGHGFSLHIPADSLPAGVNYCVLHVYASISGQYSFPEDHELVSAVYWIYPDDPGIEFKQPIRLELQHCAKKGLSDHLTFVRGSCTQSTPPQYTFKKVEKDEFTKFDEVGCGSINLSHFSPWGITVVKSKSFLQTNEVVYDDQM